MNPSKSPIFRYLWDGGLLGAETTGILDLLVTGRHREKQWQSIHGRSRIDVAPGDRKIWEDGFGKTDASQMNLPYPGTLSTNHFFNGWFHGERTYSKGLVHHPTETTF